MRETLVKFRAGLERLAALIEYGPDWARIKELAAKIARLPEGSEAIYREKGIIARVCVERIKVGSRGVELQIQLLPTPGLSGLPEGWTASSPWEFVYGDDLHLKGAYFPWMVYFDSAAIREVTRIAASWAGPMDLELYHKLSEYLNEAWL